MSETNTVETAADAKLKELLAKLQAMIPPGFKLEPNDALGAKEGYRMSWLDGGRPRTAGVVIMGLGEQFDFAEVSGAVDSDNRNWQNMAYVAGSIREIDTVPVPLARKKEALRETLDKLGLAGFNGASLVVNGYRGGDTLLQAAGVAAATTDSKALVKN